MIKSKKKGALRLLSQVLAAGVFGAAAVAHAADIKVGIIAPMSGPAAAQGMSSIEGIKAGQQYQDTVNGRKLQIIQLDDASNPSLTTRNARKLIEQDNVDVLIGTSSVPGAMALATVSREGKTPLISWTPIELNDEAAQWAVTTAASGFTMIKAVVEEMKRNGVKTVGYIGFSDAWGDVAHKALSQYAEEAGIKVVANERYARSDNSVAAQVLKVMAANPDAVLGGGAGTPGALPYISLHDRGYKGAIYGTHAILSPEFVQLVGEAGEGLILPTGPALLGDQLPADNPSKEIVQKYEQAYEAAHGEAPYDVFSAYSFDTWLILVEAAERVSKDLEPGTPEFREALRDEIKNTKDLAATVGVYSFSPDTAYGTHIESVVIVKLEDGKWKLQN